MFKSLLFAISSLLIATPVLAETGAGDRGFELCVEAMNEFADLDFEIIDLSYSKSQAKEDNLRSLFYGKDEHLEASYCVADKNVSNFVAVKYGDNSAAYPHFSPRVRSQSLKALYNLGLNRLKTESLKLHTVETLTLLGFD